MMKMMKMRFHLVLNYQMIRLEEAKQGVVMHEVAASGMDKNGARVVKLC